jgi:hypothetical protein
MLTDLSIPLNYWINIIFSECWGQSMTRTARPECGHSSDIGEDNPSVFGQLLGMPSDDIETLAAAGAWC